MKKTVLSFAVLALAAVGIAGQSDYKSKVVAEISANTPIKNAPFSADAVNESVQTLADGNRIVRSSTSKFYRDSNGRTRRELKGGTGGVMGSLFSFEPGATIMDPTGFRYMIDDHMKTARKIEVLPSRELSIARTQQLSDEQKAAIEKLRTDLKIIDGKPLTPEQRTALDKAGVRLAEVERALIVSGSGSGAALGTAVTGTAVGGMFERIPSTKYDTKTEDLGTSNMEGVEVTGTRRTTTIPAGAIGNERPIEIVYERWYSKELGVVIYSKNSDPRMGEQTYRLTNIIRAEPDPSLFTMPQGYKLIDEANTYRTVVQGGGGDKVRVAKPKTQQ